MINGQYICFQLIHIRTKKLQKSQQSKFSKAHAQPLAVKSVSIALQIDSRKCSAATLKSMLTGFVWIVKNVIEKNPKFAQK